MLIYGNINIYDISKLHMYDILYNLLNQEFKDALHLILIDTDLFIFKVKDYTKEE